MERNMRDAYLALMVLSALSSYCEAVDLWKCTLAITGRQPSATRRTRSVSRRFLPQLTNLENRVVPTTPTVGSLLSGLTTLTTQLSSYQGKLAALQPQLSEVQAVITAENASLNSLYPQQTAYGDFVSGEYSTLNYYQSVETQWTNQAVTDTNTLAQDNSWLASDQQGLVASEQALAAAAVRISPTLRTDQKEVATAKAKEISDASHLALDTRQLERLEFSPSSRSGRRQIPLVDVKVSQDTATLATAQQTLSLLAQQQATDVLNFASAPSANPSIASLQYDVASYQRVTNSVLSVISPQQGYITLDYQKAAQYQAMIAQENQVMLQNETTLSQIDGEVTTTQTTLANTYTQYGSVLDAANTLQGNISTIQGQITSDEISLAQLATEPAYFNQQVFTLDASLMSQLSALGYTPPQDIQSFAAGVTTALFNLGEFQNTSVVVTSASYNSQDPDYLVIDVTVNNGSSFVNVSGSVYLPDPNQSVIATPGGVQGSYVTAPPFSYTTSRPFKTFSYPGVILPTSGSGS
jgi:hypothetical protein